MTSLRATSSHLCSPKSALRLALAFITFCKSNEPTALPGAYSLLRSDTSPIATLSLPGYRAVHCYSPTATLIGKSPCSLPAQALVARKPNFGGRRDFAQPLLTGRSSSLWRLPSLTSTETPCNSMLSSAHPTGTVLLTGATKMTRLLSLQSSSTLSLLQWSG